LPVQEFIERHSNSLILKRSYSWNQGKTGWTVELRWSFTPLQTKPNLWSTRRWSQWQHPRRLGRWGAYIISPTFRSPASTCVWSQ